MRWLLVGWVGMLLSSAAVAWAEDAAPETYPYVAYVTGETARVHAGPGNAYYATDELTRGMTVEVYRSISGWLAIRPTVNSFCWVPAKEAELTDEPDVAMIVRDDVPAWIGTRVERDAEHLWQVQLNEGDLVKVLDVKRRPRAAGKPAESWYRIEPPEGELRFIRAADVSTEEPVEAVPEVAAADEAFESEGETPAELPEEAKVVAVPLDEPQADEAAPLAGEAEEKSVLKAQFTPRDGSPKRESAVSTPERSTTTRTSPFKDLGQASDVGAPRVASLDRSSATDTRALLSASSRFEDKLAALELELALMAARDPREWKLDPLRAHAEQLISSGQTTLERGRARLVLDKLNQFDELYTKAMDASAMPRTAGIASAVSSAPLDPTAPPVESEGLTVPDGVTYDGVGWLKPVYSAKRVAPPYALVDVDGKVLQYVTPSPGLNLNRYVKKPVGIFGQRSHLAEFKAAHLTAAKVVDLSKYQK